MYSVLSNFILSKSLLPSVSEQHELWQIENIQIRIFGHAIP